ncbi:MAG: hypothetical protein AAGJ40_09635 [Planctomycetota bacterium]
MKEPRQYRRQPIKVQAIQFTGANHDAVESFINIDTRAYSDFIEMDLPTRTEMIHEGEWVVLVPEGDPVVLGDEEFQRTHGR